MCGPVAGAAGGEGGAEESEAAGVLAFLEAEAPLLLPLRRQHQHGGGDPYQRFA